MDRGAWQATVHGVAKSQTGLSDFHYTYIWGFPGGSVVKNLPANAEDVGFIPGLGRSPGRGNGNPLQSSCLENPEDTGIWWATVHGLQRDGTRLTEHACTHPQV